MINIPSRESKKFIQTNRSDVLGNFSSSFGLDLQTNEGAIRLSEKLVTTTTTADDSDIDRVAAFEYFDDRWWAVSGTKIFKNTSEQLTILFTEDASTGVPTDFDPDKSDLAIFNNRLWGTTSNTLYSKASGSGTGAWTSRDTLGSGVHKLVYFKKFNRLYYIDTTSKISSIDTSDSVANSTGDYFIDLGNTIGDLVTIVANSTSIWAATIRVSNSTTGQAILGSVVEWDGISGEIVRDYPINNAAAGLSMVVLNDVPYVMDSEGRLLSYTGHSFEEITRLPVETALLVNATQTGGGRFVHVNGMAATKDNTILVSINNLNGDNSGSINEFLPSGIWEADIENKSFTHRYSFTLKSLSSSTVTDYGQNRVNGVGAIRLNTLSSSSSLGRGKIFASASYFTDATTSTAGIFIDSPANATTSTEGLKKGYLVTTWLESTGLIDLWDKVFSKHQSLTSPDRLDLKYRAEDVNPTYITATWVDGSTFTTTTDLTGLEGYEVEIIQAFGSGAIPHITSITNNAGTYTIVLDESVGTYSAGVTTSLARVQAWLRAGTLTELDSGEFNINLPRMRMQLKLGMSFLGDGEVREITAINKPYRKLE